MVRATLSKREIGTAGLAVASFAGGAFAGAVGLLTAQSVARQRRGATCERVNSPNPAWAPGDTVRTPFEKTGDDMVALDPAQLKSSYPLLVSAFVPRPIALVSSMSATGARNLAPFSYAGAVSHDPPAVAVSISRRPGGAGEKDTAANILETGEFVVNIISEWYAEAANHTSGEFGPEDDEFAIAGLTPARSDCVAPPRVGEAAVALECRLTHRHDIGGEAAGATLVVGEVKMFHVQRALLLDDGGGQPRVRFDGPRPVSRLGGNSYGLTTTLFDLPRPKV